MAQVGLATWVIYIYIYIYIYIKFHMSQLGVET